MSPVKNIDMRVLILLKRYRKVICTFLFWMGCLVFTLPTHAQLFSPGKLAGPKYIQYTELAFRQCTACHEDAHDGSFGVDCASCHNLPDHSLLFEPPPASDQVCIACHYSDYDDEQTGSGFPNTCSDCHDNNWDADFNHDT